MQNPHICEKNIETTQKCLRIRLLFDMDVETFIYRESFHFTGLFI